MEERTGRSAVKGSYTLGVVNWRKGREGEGCGGKGWKKKERSVKWEKAAVLLLSHGDRSVGMWTEV